MLSENELEPFQEESDRFQEEVESLKTLTAKGRRHIKESNFALPGRRYPIHDRTHARSALQRVSQHGTETEKARVRRAVKRKYPGIKISNSDHTPLKAYPVTPTEYFGNVSINSTQVFPGEKHQDLKAPRSPKGQSPPRAFSRGIGQKTLDEINKKYKDMFGELPKKFTQKAAGKIIERVTRILGPIGAIPIGPAERKKYGPKQPRSHSPDITIRPSQKKETAT